MMTTVELAFERNGDRHRHPAVSIRYRRFAFPMFLTKLLVYMTPMVTRLTCYVPIRPGLLLQTQTI